MSDLTEQLRAVAEEWWECCGDIHVPIITAADALEAAEAKLAAIDAFHMPSIGMAQTCCYCISSWPCTTHLILHPEEEQ